jgi:hypothetical protein
MQKYICSAGGFAAHHGAPLVGPSERLVYLASDVDALVIELREALRSFALAHGHAVAFVRLCDLPKPMDRRDLFMWQAGRSLCVDDYVAAAKAYGGQTTFGITS